MNFETDCITYIQQLKTQNIFIEGNLIGVNEVTKIAKAKVAVDIDGIAHEKYIIIYDNNNTLFWKYINIKDRIDNEYDPNENGWAYPSFSKRIVAPIQLIMDDIGIKMYGWFNLNELPVMKVSESVVHLYCNIILPEHQAIIDNLHGVISIEYIENF